MRERDCLKSDDATLILGVAAQTPKHFLLHSQRYPALRGGERGHICLAPLTEAMCTAARHWEMHVVLLLRAKHRHRVLLLHSPRLAAFHSRQICTSASTSEQDILKLLSLFSSILGLDIK